MDGGHDPIFHEHQATQIVAGSLVELVELVSRPQERPSSYPLALGATPEGDPYVLPGLLGEADPPREGLGPA